MIELVEEQKNLLKRIVENRENLFFTGSAGTGKSTLLKSIIHSYEEKYGENTIAVTALTGLAASRIGGTTLHSFSGIGLGNPDAEELIKRVRSRTLARDRWISYKALVIDEISMLEATLLEKLDMIGRAIRKQPNKPFGGLQIIATGDFLQLPPICKDKQARYAFESEKWDQIFPISDGCQQILKNIHRQSDPLFIEYLQNFRQGIVTKEMKKIFGKELCRSVEYPDNLEPTCLFPTRQQVSILNENKLEDLSGEVYTYHAIDQCHSGHSFHLEKLQKDCVVEKEVRLKVGAQVMLLKNLSDKLVNGSLGIVKEFMPSTGTSPSPIVEFQIYGANGITPENKTTVALALEVWNMEEKNKVVASRTQIPLTLAYALSIHKSQSQTISRLKVDLGRIFEKGQGYVALSRAESMERLQVLNFDPKKIMADEKVIEYYQKIEAIQGIQRITIIK